MFYTEIVVLSTYLGFEQIKTKPSNQTFSACYGYSKPLSYKIVGGNSFAISAFEKGTVFKTNLPKNSYCFKAFAGPLPLYEGLIIRLATTCRD